MELCYVVLTPNNTTFGDEDGIQRSRDVSYEKYNDHRPLTWNLIWKPTVSCRRRKNQCRAENNKSWRPCPTSEHGCCIERIGGLSSSTQLTFRDWQRNGWVGKLRLKSLSLHLVLLTTRRSVHCSTAHGWRTITKHFHTLPDTGDETDYAECVQALNKYFEIRKNVPKERQNILSVLPEGRGGGGGKQSKTL